MAQKKIIYDLDGKIKESSGNYYDDSNSTIVLKNVTFNTMSLPLQDGIAFISSSQISSSGLPPTNGVVTWNNVQNKWDFISTEVDVTNQTASSTWDVSGTFGINLTVKSLSNVSSGSPLPVLYGGTGLSLSQYPTGESILVGNGINPFSIISASNNSNKPILLSTLTGWSYITQSVQTASVEVQIFTGSGIWNKPINTKTIRIIAQGAGGGGGSGANRNSAIAALGGTGGGGGQLVDTGYVFLDDSTTSLSITVGSGGIGGNIPVAGSGGNNGNPGGDSIIFTGSVALVTASGGSGGVGGNLSSTTSAGGSGGSNGTSVLDNFLYNTQRSIIPGLNGNINSTTVFNPTSSITLASGLALGGGSGGSLIADFATAYNGGSGLYYPDNATTTQVKSFSLNGILTDEYEDALADTGATGAWNNTNVTFDSSIKKFNQSSAYFNGINAYLYRHVSPMSGFIEWINNNNAAYFECWVRPEQLGSTMTILWAGSSATSEDMVFKILSDGSIQYSSLAFSATTTAKISANKWTHLAFSHQYVNSTTKYIRIFINGQLVLGPTLYNNAFDGYLYPTIGKNYKTNTDYFKGWINGIFIARTLSTLVSSNFIPLQSQFTKPNGGTVASKNAPTINSGSLLDYFSLNSSEISNTSQANNIYQAVGGGGGASFPSNISGSGGLGANGAYGSGGGGGGASTAAVSGTRQGGNGGDGYVVIVSYKN